MGSLSGGLCPEGISVQGVLCAEGEDVSVEGVSVWCLCPGIRKAGCSHPIRMFTLFFTYGPDRNHSYISSWLDPGKNLGLTFWSIPVKAVHSEKQRDSHVRIVVQMVTLSPSTNIMEKITKTSCYLILRNSKSLKGLINVTLAALK